MYPVKKKQQLQIGKPFVII